jgi:hypothetical protein
MNELMRVLSFTAADLALNQQGKLSIAQQRRLLYQQVLWGTLRGIDWRRVAIGVGVFFLVVVTAISEWLIVLVLLIALGYFAWLIGEQLRKTARNAETARVLSYRGRVRHFITRGQHYLELSDSTNLPVQSYVMHAFADDGLYRLYYTADTLALVAAELLQQTPVRKP